MHGSDASPAAPPDRELADATSWAVQLSGYERGGAFDRLARAQADVIVIDPIRSVRGRESFPVKAVVAQIHARPGPALKQRLVLAYLNVAQWEDYRVGADSVPADLLLSVDPDGWSGHRQVRYWDSRWQASLFGPDGALDAILADGFDGVFLDWVLGYHEESVQAAAAADGVDARAEMETLLRRLDAAGERARPGFVVVAQNASGLFAESPDLASVVDGVSIEPVSFAGVADAAWDDLSSADTPTTDAFRHQVEAGLRLLGRVGVVALTLDYATTPAHVAEAERRARSVGAIPFVSRTPLDRLPTRVLDAR